MQRSVVQIRLGALNRNLILFGYRANNYLLSVRMADGVARRSFLKIGDGVTGGLAPVGTYWTLPQCKLFGLSLEFISF